MKEGEVRAMNTKRSGWIVGLTVLISSAGTMDASAQQALGTYANDLVVSSSTYTDPGFSAGAALPDSAAGAGTAVVGSAFCASANCSVNVWNNESNNGTTVDGNFGVTSSIYMQDVNATTGTVDNTVNVSALAAAENINLSTSFSSKSELAINLTPDGNSITFMGYVSGQGALDVSNSNTPGVVDSTNSDTQTPTYRAVAQLNLNTNALQVSTTNSYSGNNGRAAILGLNGVYYTVGNAGNGSKSSPQIAAVGAATGVQQVTPGQMATASTGTVQVGQYNITQQGYAADNVNKDNNFRGETVYNNTLYITKGSGSNGIDTVYQVGMAGTMPASGTSTPITILPGFNTKTVASDAMTPHPFGIWFANASTLYVADEGSGATSDFGASPTTLAGGLQKYSLINGMWQLDYTLKGSLIGGSYTVNGTGSLAGDSLTTTTDGLRNLTGQVNANGTVTLYALTSTVGSVLGDAGADPNKLVAITDNLSYSTAAQAAGENYTTLETAALGQVLRGVSLNTSAVPEPSTWALMAGGLLLVAAFARRRSRA
jgi:hypothetical protein